MKTQSIDWARILLEWHPWNWAVIQVKIKGIWKGSKGIDEKVEFSLRMRRESMSWVCIGVSKDISYDAKKHVLCRHSEKNTIKCALIYTCKGTPINVKNLWICNDCHLAMAIISKIVQQRICSKMQITFMLLRKKSENRGTLAVFIWNVDARMMEVSTNRTFSWQKKKRNDGEGSFPTLSVGYNGSNLGSLIPDWI